MLQDVGRPVLQSQSLSFVGNKTQKSTFFSKNIFNKEPQMCEYVDILWKELRMCGSISNE